MRLLIVLLTLVVAMAVGILLGSLAQADPLPIVSDHTTIAEFDTIPPNILALAASKRVLFKHASVGEQISTRGLDCIAGTAQTPIGTIQFDCLLYIGSPYDNSLWDWPPWVWIGGGSSFALKLGEFESDVNTLHDSSDVFGMKLCYIDTWQEDFAVYRDMMLALEAAYPTKTFIWATQALSRGDEFPAMQAAIASFNTQLRAYVQANGKVLYDLADIESHREDGTLCVLGEYETICDEWRADLAGHPNRAGAIRLAKGFWVLMSKIVSAEVATPTPVPTATAVPTATFMPAPTATSLPTATSTPTVAVPTPTVAPSPTATPTPACSATAPTGYVITNPNSVAITVTHVLTDTTGFRYEFQSGIMASSSQAYSLADMPQVPLGFIGAVTLRAGSPFVAVITARCAVLDAQR